MKRIGMILGCILLLGSFAGADVPRTINYQGRLTDHSGNPLPDATYSIAIRLYDAENAPEANSIWNDLFSVQTKNGYFNVALGSGNTLTAAFDKPYWLGIKVGGDSEMTPRQALNSVPYALMVPNNSITTAQLADWSVTKDDLVNSAVISAKIEDNAVNSDKLADGAVNTQAKAPWAPRVWYQGLWRNNPIIAGGLATTDINGNATLDITSCGFTQPPRVVCTADRSDLLIVMNVFNVSTSSFDVKSRIGNGTGVTSNFYWIAIGF